MTRYEYKVVPAPSRGTKAKGVRSPEGRFAVSIETVLNEMGAQGWEYLRAELLPSEERSGLTGSTTNWRNVLVFRRPLDAGAMPNLAPSWPEPLHSQVAETGLPPLGGAARHAPAPANSGEPLRARAAEELPAGRTPPLVASRQGSADEDEEDDTPPEPRGPETGIEKVMRFTARNRTPD